MGDATPPRESIEEQATIFSALADPTRLKLVQLLSQQQHPDALCVNALAGFLGVTQSAVSQHLRVLRAIGLVKSERRGYHIHYFINRDAMERCRELASSALNIQKQADTDSCQNYCSEKRRK